MRIHTHIHKNSPTITPPSLLYFLLTSFFSMLSLSLEKLVTCGVIRAYNFGVQTCRLPALTPSGCLFGSPNPAGQGTKPHQQLFLGLQTCRLPALKPSRCLFGNPNPAGQGTKTPSIAFFGVQTCRLPALKPSKCLFGIPNPTGQGTKTPPIALSWHSNLSCTSPQTLQTISKPKHRGQLEPKLLTTFRPILFPTEGRVAMGQVKSQFTSIFDIQRPFRAKGLRWAKKNPQFYLSF